jgi:hypothetical protein
MRVGKILDLLLLHSTPTSLKVQCQHNKAVTTETGQPEKHSISGQSSIQSNLSGNDASPCIEVQDLTKCPVIETTAPHKSFPYQVVLVHIFAFISVLTLILKPHPLVASVSSFPLSLSHSLSLSMSTMASWVWEDEAIL